MWTDTVSLSLHWLFKLTLVHMCSPPVFVGPLRRLSPPLCPECVNSCWYIMLFSPCLQDLLNAACLSGVCTVARREPGRAAGACGPDRWRGAIDSGIGWGAGHRYMNNYRFPIARYGASFHGERGIFDTPNLFSSIRTIIGYRYFAVEYTHVETQKATVTELFPVSGGRVWIFLPLEIRRD